MSFVPFFHVMGAKDRQCKYMPLLVSLRKTVVSSLPLYLINKTCKNYIFPLRSTSYVNLIF